MQKIFWKLYIKFANACHTTIQAEAALILQDYVVGSKEFWLTRVKDLKISNIEFVVSLFALELYRYQDWSK